jgi:exodeoxyribonuclease III
VNPKWKNDCSAERWDSAERNIIQNHTQLGMHDAFRSLNDYQDQSGSWFINRKDLQLGRRYDHVFCSQEIKPIHCYYDHEPRENKLSDHSPVIAELSL